MVKPAAADRPDRAGAEAFARYWIDELNAAYDTLDTRKLKAISQSTCQTCQNYIASLDRSRREGERYEGGELLVSQSVVAPGETAFTSVLLNCSEREATVLRPDNTVVTEVAEQRGLVLEFEAVRARIGWKAAEVIVRKQ